MQFKAHQIVLTNRRRRKIIFFVKVSTTHPLVDVRGQSVVVGFMLCCLVSYAERRESVFQRNLSISVSYHRFSTIKCWAIFVSIETEIPLFERVEQCQETVQSKTPIYIELFLSFTRQPCQKHNQFCYHFNICLFKITSPIDRKYLIGGLIDQLLNRLFLTMAIIIN